MGYDHTLCTLAGRPHTPQQRDTGGHPVIREEDLIKKKDLFDPLDDDDNIEWKHNPFDADHVSESEELLAKITFEGSEYLQTKLWLWFWNSLMFLLPRCDEHLRM